MSVIKSSDINNYGTVTGHTHCSICQEYMDKWINVYQVGNMCIDCAQNMMRIMFENIIEYHIGTRVNLLDIMRHGNPDNDVMSMFWLEKRFPEFYPEKIEEYNTYMKRELEDHNRRKKSEESSKLVNDEPKPRHCTICQELVNKWIDVYPGYTICIDCTQYTMRTMFEDILEYHNGIKVTLLEIMCYGRFEIDEMRAEEKRYEEYTAKSQTSCNLFDFDNTNEELEK